LARTQYEYARLLSGRGPGRDHRRAADLRKRGLQIANDLGMDGLRARFTALKAP
jgi:hypothetical protein